MPTYAVNAVDRSGSLITIAATRTAREALDTFRVSLRHYPRAWVSDEAGNDVSESDLMDLAAEEGQGA